MYIRSIEHVKYWCALNNGSIYIQTQVYNVAYDHIWFLPNFFVHIFAFLILCLFFCIFLYLNVYVKKGCFIKIYSSVILCINLSWFHSEFAPLLIFVKILFWMSVYIFLHVLFYTNYHYVCFLYVYALKSLYFFL